MTNFVSCPDCGKGELKGERGLGLHKRFHCRGEASDNVLTELTEETIDIPEEVMDEVQNEPEPEPEPEAPKRSRRGMARYGRFEGPAPILDQIRSRPGGMFGGPAAYYIRPDGATIMEALIIYPNGAPIKNVPGKDARDRQAEKGFTYVGPTLSREGIELLVATIAKNRPDYKLFLEEEITNCQHIVDNSDSPQERDNQRKRKVQFEKLLEEANQKLDADKIFRELDDIMRAQKLARVSPEVREALELQLPDLIKDLAKRFESKSMTGEGGLSVTVRNEREEATA